MTKRTKYTALAAALSLFLVGGSAMADDDRRTGDRNTGDNTSMTDTNRNSTDPNRNTAASDRNTMGDSDQPVGDTWITTKVKASMLADDDVAGLQVEVETVNGVVTLSGDVESQAQADEAERIASEIEGVTRVDASGLRVSRGN